MKKIVFIIGCFFTFLSCEDLLEVDQPQNQLFSADIFKDKNTTEAALSDLYASLLNNSIISGGINGSGALLGTYTDDLDNYSISTTNAVYDLHLNIHNSNNSTVLTVWTNAYKLIYATNLFLEGVSNSSTLHIEDKERFKGEALTIRSLIYYYLYNIYGDIPLVLSTDYTYNNSISRSGTSLIKNQLVQDLEGAIELLQDTYRNTERIYINKKAAQILLSKVYLDKKEYGNAERALKAIIQSPIYSYEYNIDKVFDKNGNHIIWQLKPKNNQDATTEAMLYHFSNSYPSNYAISQNLLNSFLDSDLRKERWINNVYFNGEVFFYPYKYKNRSNNINEYSIIFRLEEAYLLLAESLIEQNKLKEGVYYLNYSRKRAGLHDIDENTTKGEILEYVIKENQLEFFSEHGNRFLTLKRLEKLNRMGEIKSNWKSFHERWPIPQNEMILNPNLLPQHEGY